MDILVVSSTEFEIAPLRKSLPDQKILISGIGASQSILNLSKEFHRSTYQLVIQSGIAGAFHNGVSDGEVVSVFRDRFADLGVLENGNLKDLTEGGLTFENCNPYSAGWLENHFEWIEKINLKSVSAVTVQLVGDTPRLSHLIKEKYNPDIESMEGAAFHFTCMEYNLPFVQIRSVSNRVGERNKSKWKLDKAVQNLNAQLIRIISDLKKK